MMKGDKRFIMALKDSSILNKKIKQATKGKAMVNYFFLRRLHALSTGTHVYSYDNGPA